MPARRSAAKIFGCGVGSARRSGARVGFLRLDEPASRGLFLFINVSSGSFRWIKGSHEPNDPRERKRRTRRRVPAGGTFFGTAFFCLRCFLFLRVRGDWQYRTGGPACFCISDRPVFLLRSFSVLRRSRGHAGAPRPGPPPKGMIPFGILICCRAGVGTFVSSAVKPFSAMFRESVLRCLNRRSPGRLESMADRGVRLIYILPETYRRNQAITKRCRASNL